MLSSDLKHDGFAVNKFVEKAVEHLENEDIPVRRIIMFSDNCGPQYKSCKVFETLSRKEIPVIRNYFGASHGKGEADGAIGRLSMTIDAVVRSGTAKLDNTKELVDFCKDHLTLGGHTETMCCHYHRHYFELSDIERDEDADIKGIKGTLGFHSVRNTSIPGVIEVRESSCFCEPCFLGHPGECRNSRLVNKFKWASLYKPASAKGDLAKTITILDNPLWGGESEKYIPPVKRTNPRKRTIKRSRKRSVTNPEPSRSVPNKNDQLSDNGSVNNPRSSTLGQNKNDDFSDSDDEDWDVSSSESDYESCIPLAELRSIKFNSPISSRTRARMYEKELVPCIYEAPKYDLDDIENGQPDVEEDRSVLMPNAKLYKGSKKDDDASRLGISGIQPLTPGSSGIDTQSMINRHVIDSTDSINTEGKGKKARNDHVDKGIGKISSKKRGKGPKCILKQRKLVSNGPNGVGKNGKMHNDSSAGQSVLGGMRQKDEVIDLTNNTEYALNSTPKIGETVDLTSLAPEVLSPILPLDGNQSRANSSQLTRSITDYRWNRLHRMFQSC